MWVIPKHAKPYLRFKSFDLKRLWMILKLIPFISADKAIVCGSESRLRVCISKIESFHIANEDIFGDIFNSANIPTFINALLGMIQLGSSICDHFLSFGSIFSLNSPIMVALYPEYEISSSLYHFLVCGFVIFKFF